MMELDTRQKDNTYGLRARCILGCSYGGLSGGGEVMALYMFPGLTASMAKNKFETRWRGQMYTD